MTDQFPFNALRAFEAVARNGSFTRAADELHVTQSAVSHQVKLLEQWLGRPLLQRRGASFEVPPHGRQLAAVLARSLSEIRHACLQARDAGRSRGLALAVIPSVATCWLIPKMSEFRALHPQIATRILYAIHGQQIDFNEVDAAIIYSAGPLQMQGARATKLLQGSSAPVCSRSFLDLHGPLRGPADFAASALLHDTDQQGWARWFLKATGRGIGFSDGPVFEDFNLLRAATLAGQGISLCPLAIIHDDLLSDRLVQLSDITVLDESAYYLLESARPNQETRPEQTLFRQWLETARDRQG